METTETNDQLPVETIAGFIEWIVEAMEYVPLNNEAKVILDMLIGIQQENK